MRDVTVHRAEAANRISVAGEDLVVAVGVHDALGPQVELLAQQYCATSRHFPFDALLEALLNAQPHPALDREPLHAGDVLHFPFPFNGFEIVPHLGFKFA